MKVLISLSYYIPNISGLTFYVRDLAMALSKKGDNVTILSAKFKENLKKVEINEGITLIRVPTIAIFKKIPVMPFYFFYAYEQVKKTDVINCHYPQPEGLLLIFLAKLFKKKIVVTYHTDLALNDSFLSVVVILQNYLSLLLADKIVVTSEDYAKNSFLLSKFMSKIEEIYPIVNKPKLDISEKKHLEEKLFSGKKKICIGFLGRIVQEKGLEYLFYAIPMLKEKLGDEFVIAVAGGDAIGEMKYKEKITSLSQTYANHVVWLGKLSQQQIGAFYANLNVFVLPSVNATEAFGIVQIEAMLYNVPVVATNLPGVRVPIAITHMGKIVKPKNAQALAEGILEVLNKKKEFITKENEKNLTRAISEEKSITAYQKLFS